MTEKKLREIARATIAEQLKLGSEANQIIMNIAVAVLHTPSHRGE